MKITTCAVDDFPGPGSRYSEKPGARSSCHRWANVHWDDEWRAKRERERERESMSTHRSEALPAVFEPALVINDPRWLFQLYPRGKLRKEWSPTFSTQFSHRFAGAVWKIRSRMPVTAVGVRNFTHPEHSKTLSLKSSLWSCSNYFYSVPGSHM